MDFISWLTKNDTKEFSFNENTVSQIVKSNPEIQKILKTITLPKELKFPFLKNWKMLPISSLIANPHTRSQIRQTTPIPADDPS